MQNAIRSLLRNFAKYGAIAFVLLMLANQSTADSFINETTFGDWLVSCSAAPEAKGPACLMSQRIEFADNNDPLLNVELYLNPANGKPEAVFILPLGIPLTTQPVLSFNHSRGFSLTVSHCHNDGCYFKEPLNSALLETFLSMQSGQITLRGNDNEAIKIPISGKGSRAAYNYFDSLLKD